ncbi:MAG: hypothetical protein V1888_01960 [archaeon]
MKRVVLLLVLFGLIFVSAVDAPTTGIGSEDVEKIQNLTGSLPINHDTGQIDFDKYDFKTKADARIAAVNEYVGPITKVLFGVELTLSWIFIFSVVLWILLIEIIVMPVSEIFDWNIWWSLTGAGIIATLAMQGFGKDFVVYIEALVTQWYIGAMVIVIASIFGVVYSVAMKYFGKEIEMMKEAAAKAQRDQDSEVIHVRRKLAEKEIKGLV